MSRREMAEIREALRQLTADMQTIVSRTAESGHHSTIRLVKKTGAPDGSGNAPVVFYNLDETARQSTSKLSIPDIPAGYHAAVDLGQKDWYTLPKGGTHDVSADEGTPVTLEDGDTLDFDMTDLLWSNEANSTKNLRGVVVQVLTDDTDTETGTSDTTIKRLKVAVDKSVLQNIGLTGTATSGTDPVLVRSGTRNSIELIASTTSPVTLIGGAGSIEFQANDPFHYIKDDQATPNTEDFDYKDTLEFVHPTGEVVVSKLGSVVTVTLPGDSLPIGSVIMGVKAPILDTGKYYLDDGTGSANTQWALMDGTSNATPGSGIQMATESGTEAEFFVRALSGTGAATNTRYGRDSTAVTADPDDDEVQIEVDDHVDHYHTIVPDACHGDVASPDTHFDFSSITGKLTTQQQNASGTNITLSHSVTLTNHQGIKY